MGWLYITNTQQEIESAMTPKTQKNSKIIGSQKFAQSPSSSSQPLPKNYGNFFAK